MKKLKRITAAVIVWCMMLCQPLPIGQIKPIKVQAAAQTAASMEEMAAIVREHGMKRDKSFSVKYRGKSSDVDKFIEDEDFTFFNTTLALADDPDTSDDADYLVGNLNFSNKYDIYAVGNTITFKLEYFETEKQTEYVNSRIPGILKKLKVANKSNYEKVKAIHDYVCELITYKDDVAKCSSMYSALKNGKGLCNSYALCMYKLLVEAGVPCKYIGGTAGTGRDSGGHAWNIVALGDKWYYVDCTWDDGEEEGTYYDYFLKGSSDFDKADPSQKHKMDKSYRTGEFAAKFPIAKKAFKKGSNDENENITIGGSEDAEYRVKDVVEGSYPSSRKFTVKKNKTGELQVFLRKGFEDMISDVKYKVTSGKSCIGNIKNYGLCVDDGEYFTALTFKGKKQGKVSIQIILELTNGQSLKVSFSGKIK